MASKSRKQRREQDRKQKATSKFLPKKKSKSSIFEIYDTEYKKLMLIPIGLLLISFIILGVRYFNTGEFINKGVSIKGGVSVTIPTTDLNANDAELFLTSRFPTSDIVTRTISSSGVQSAIIVEASDIDENLLKTSLESQYNLNNGDYTLEITGSSLGETFYKQIIIAIIFAFIFMGLVVYIYFRTLVPSAAIMLAAFSDMIITLAVISLLDIRITTAGIAAFLMLIGYSVDTDILLTTRVLKRTEGTIMDRVISALKTGMTMNVTTIAAVTVALFVSTSEVIKQIMIILLIGLFADIINTWIQNVGLLRLYLERTKK